MSTSSSWFTENPGGDYTDRQNTETTEKIMRIRGMLTEPGIFPLLPISSGFRTSITIRLPDEHKKIKKKIITTMTLGNLISNVIYIICTVNSSLSIIINDASHLFTLDDSLLTWRHGKTENYKTQNTKKYVQILTVLHARVDLLEFDFCRGRSRK